MTTDLGRIPTGIDKDTTNFLRRVKERSQVETDFGVSILAATDAVEVQTILGLSPAASSATTSAEGLIELATQAEVDASDATRAVTGATLAAWSGQKVIQIVNTQTGAVATGTTPMVNDDTIPQNTEGDEYMSLAITPGAVGNKLKIDVVWYGSASVNDRIGVALFQDSTASALAAVVQQTGLSSRGTAVSFTHFMTAGVTSATTFKVRAGLVQAGTTTFNGESGARKLGGVSASSVTITEVAP